MKCSNATRSAYVYLQYINAVVHFRFYSSTSHLNTSIPFPMSQTTTITVNFKGSSAAVKYCAERSSHQHRGCTSSLRQLRKQLCLVFGVPHLDLYCIANRKMHALTTDSHIRRAIRASGGHSLLVTAYEPQYIKYNAVESPLSFLETSKPQETPSTNKPVTSWRVDAPAAPLSPKDVDSIRRLQYILVKLGYLHHSNSTSISKTEDAVARFRRKYQIISHDMKEYDTKTARKLAQVVRKYRADGHKSI